MKESYRKGIANHPDPESCIAHHQKEFDEALTGAQAGRILSCEINFVWRCRRRFVRRKATLGVALNACHSRTHAVIDPRHAWKFHVREPGGPAGVRQQVVRRTDGEGDEL